MELAVECYAGHRGEQEPRAFSIGARRVCVEEIIDRWISPLHRYFKVRADDGDVYILRHDEPSGLWTLTMYEAQRLAAAPIAAEAQNRELPT